MIMVVIAACLANAQVAQAMSQNQQAVIEHKEPHPAAQESTCKSRPKGRGGFAKAAKDSKQEPFALHAVTVNATTWSSAQQFLLATDANVVMLQEHRLMGEEIAKAKLWATKHGWGGIFNDARPTLGKKGKASRSAGVAILARIGIGLRRDTIETARPDRLIAAILECPGSPPISGICAYFET
jgi:hypothetical protein